jgi:feruloyl esterase
MIDLSKTPLRTMPLCKFPEMARYDGKGDVNQAASWHCDASDKRMLKVGESGRQAGVID